MDFATIKELENRYSLKNVKQNLCFVHGDGSYLYDSSGRAYLDLVCARGESCLGYSNKLLVSAVTAQAEKLFNLSAKFYSTLSGQVMKQLASFGFSKVCITASPVEAVTTAMEMTLAYLKNRGKSKIVVAGREQNLCALPNSTYIEFNNFDALKRALTPDVGVLVISPITDGVKIADYDYLVNAYALCRSLDIVLFCDETRIGFGRSGSRFAFETYGVQPDIVCVSRALAGGLPIGAVLTRDNIALSHKPLKRFESGNLLSLAAADVVLSVIDDLLPLITERGEYLISKLYKLTKHNFVVDVRGRGLIACVELSEKLMAAKVASQMEKLGFLIGYSEGNLLRFSPAYTITTEQIDQAIDALSELFASTNV